MRLLGQPLDFCRPRDVTDHFSPPSLRFFIMLSAADRSTFEESVASLSSFSMASKSGWLLAIRGRIGW